MKTSTLPVRGEFVPILSWELLMEILSWLPVKTLMKFKCVSKLWKSLISKDKAFLKLHLERSSKNNHVLISFLFGDVIPCPVDRLLEDPSFMAEHRCIPLEVKYSMVGSCNSLVCFSNRCVYGGMAEFWVRLWNPATGLWSEDSPTFSMDRNTIFAFGYDNSSNTYKVVALSNYDCTSKLETNVYCIGDSRWRKNFSSLDSSLSLKKSDAQFVGDCVNWLALKSKSPNHNQNLGSIQQMAILSFDMHKEIYRSFSVPEGISEVEYIGVLGNCLCLFQELTTNLVVWQMRKYGVGESWTRLVSVSYNHLQCHNVALKPLMCLCEDGGILMLVKYFKFDGVMYNLKDNSVKFVQLPPNKMWGNVISYVESLVSPY